MYFSGIVLLYERNPVKAIISIAREKRNDLWQCPAGPYTCFGPYT